VVLLLLITAVALRARDNAISLSLALVPCSLVPMIGLVQVGEQAMATANAYIPFIGLFLMIVWLIADWVADWKRLGKFPLAGSRFRRFAFCRAGILTTASRLLARSGVILEARVGAPQDNYIAHEALAGFCTRRAEPTRLSSMFGHDRHSPRQLGPPSWLLRTMNFATGSGRGYRAYQMVADRAGEQVGFAPQPITNWGLSITNSGNWRRRSSVSNNRSAYANQPMQM